MKRAKLALAIGITVLTSLIVTGILLIRSDVLHLRVFPAIAAEETVSVHHTPKKTTLTGKNRVYYVQPREAEAAQLQQSTKVGLSYAKVEFQDLTADQIATVEPDANSTLLVADADVADYEAALLAFIENGGNVVFMAPLDEPSKALQAAIGVQEFGKDEKVTGLHFDQEVYPGYPNVIENDSDAFAHNVNALTLVPQAETLISAQEQPLLVSHDTKGGTVQYWNTHYLADKLARGLFVQSLTRLQPVSVTAQAGIQVMHIDDFPAPVPEATTTVATAAGDTTTVADFYAHYWWPDMAKLAKQYHLKYTGALIGTYGNDVSGQTVDLYAAMRKTGQKYTRELMQLGGELSMHGFNHQPLLLAEDPVDAKLKYKAWPDQATMEQSLTQVANLVDTLDSRAKVTTYVPPSNLLSDTGIQALGNVFEDLDTVAALYFGDQTSSRYVTEYGENQADSALFNFPRNVSGYANTPKNRYEIAEVAATFSVVSHFIHPDDVFDQARGNGANWPTLAEGYAEQLEFIATNFPQITPMTQRLATATLKQYFKGAVDVAYSDKQIEVMARHLPTNASVNVRLQDGRLATGDFKNRKVTQLSDGLYSVQLKQAAVTIPVVH
ncbi:DUF2194 domain-containing protein [Lacticaseibacillus jixiensis]|uniref:DUF2194 domain-containing protein n=1 Tax=Lacticaseibacillus jixiensis TaxID=3231926 RepID=UPI0036F2B48E